MDFSTEDLFDAIDRIIAEAFSRVGIEEPPVDAIHLAVEGYQFQIEYAEPRDPSERRYGDQPRRRPSSDTIVLQDDMADESQHTIAARAVAKRMLPDILKKLGVHPETENRQANNQLMSLIAPRILLPSRWIPGDFGRAGYDLLEIKEKYSSANYEMIALRMLDLEEPCVIAIVDADGTIFARRSNRFQAPKKLTEAELRCKETIEKTGEPAKVKGSGWIVWGWPIQGIPFRRMVFRSIPEDV